jgi:transcriptional regulator with GAF, ATPase, and Fis domain
MASSRGLAETFVELADTLVEDFDVIDFLHVLATRSVDLLDVEAAGLMLVDQRGRLAYAAASTEQARLLELFQLQENEGPCLDCYHSAGRVVAADLTVDSAAAGPRWPRFTPYARELGFASVYALPLRLRDRVIGALNLFAVGTAGLSESDLRTGQALADVATIGILQQRTIREGEVLATQLQSALSSRVHIEQAKGVLAERWQVNVDEAFAALRDHARRTNQRLTDLARLVATGELTLGGPDL